ncbi:hypothetical protein FACS1894167_03370 [Synergistales bacterium]|nr:hypothetical protein FACS1894167_03370 [Synergistales bacterium]
MKTSARRKVSIDDDLSPREKRELRARGEYVEEEEESRKAPLFLRMVAMGAMLVIVFACGYGIMSLVFKWMDSRNIESPANLASTGQEAENLLAAAKSADTEAANPGTETITLSIPDGGTFATRDIRCNSGIREDIMQQAVSAYMDALKESKQLDPVAQTKNIFQSGDWLYLNVNQSFFDSIKTLEAEKATFIITGLVRTMARNFPPVNKVKFYVEGKEIKDKKPIDLTMPWSIKGS